MKSLLLLLPLCVYAFYSSPTEKNGPPEARFGHRSTENKEHLAKLLHGDPEKVRAHLAQISRRMRRPTSGERSKLRQRHEKIRRVKLGKPREDGDFLEINKRRGIAPYLYDGDIVMTDAQLTALESSFDHDSTTRNKRQVSLVTQRWTDNTVYYYFDESLDNRKRDAVAAAIDYLQSRTCIKFVENATAPNRIEVFYGYGCYSNIGMTNGVQYLSLDDGCEVIGTVAHEFTHALGVFHSQSRSDRDDHVTVDVSVVQDGMEGNFEKLAGYMNTNYTPYEYGSFMHYSASAFAPGHFSITPKDPKYAYTMGHRQISFYDIEMINRHYGCYAKCPLPYYSRCQNGGIPNPNNCAVCNCPAGYGGDFCEKRPPGCGETVPATKDWQQIDIVVGNSSNYNTRDVFTLCNYWITAPKDTKIQAKIVEMDGRYCYHGCSFNGIEVKTDPDTRVTNPKYCCEEFLNEELTSELNPTPIIAYNREHYSRFVVKYRYIDGSEAGTTTPVTPSTTRTTAFTTTSNTLPYMPRNCSQGNSEERHCIAKNICTDPEVPFRDKKRQCALTCGLCGKPIVPCVDNISDCHTIRKLEGWASMSLEYACAKTFGYCEDPN